MCAKVTLKWKVMWFLCLMLFFVPHVSSEKGNKLLLILVDGCRWDYPNQDPALKGFRRIADNGVRTVSLTPIFPTNSYPNWLTLVTGLYAESHGFVNNMMYDDQYNDFFLMAPNETASVQHWWNQAEPLWITAEKNGRRSALYWWDGCQVEIRGRKPSYCKPYKYVGSSWPDVNKHMEEAISTSLELLENDEIQLVQIYYEPVDFNGHRFGPNSDERKAAVKNIDGILDDLQTQMRDRGLDDKVNLVIVSDHGMTSTDPKNLNVINLQHIVDVSAIKYMIYYGSSCMILPEDGYLDELYVALKKVPGLNVYKKDEIPERYHLKHNRLVMPLLLVANRDFYIKGLDIPGKSIPTGSSISLGSHGYDVDDVPEMKGIFYARGPNFRQGYTAPPLENVDMYNILCECLDIDPLPNNGSRSRVNAFLIQGNAAPDNCSRSMMMIISSILLCLTLTLKSVYL